MSAVPGRSQTSSHRSPQGEGTPVNAVLNQVSASGSRIGVGATGTALDVSGISRHFPVGQGLLRGKLGGVGRSVKAVDGVGFQIRRGSAD